MVCLHVGHLTVIIYLHFQIPTKICRNLISRIFFRSQYVHWIFGSKLLTACKRNNLRSNQNTYTIISFALHLRLQWNTFPNPYAFHDSFSLLFVFFIPHIEFDETHEKSWIIHANNAYYSHRIFRCGICRRALYNMSISSWLYIASTS